MRRWRNVDPAVQQRAKELRAAMTPAEQVLWEGVRKGRIDGLQFRKQHPIDRFILDFYCAPLKLCIEVDGAVHDAQRERDEERTIYLGAAGITVLRFTNDEVLSGMPDVVRRIRDEAHRLAQEPAPSSSTSPPTA